MFMRSTADVLFEVESNYRYVSIRIGYGFLDYSTIRSENHTDRSERTISLCRMSTERTVPRAFARAAAVMAAALLGASLVACVDMPERGDGSGTGSSGETEAPMEHGIDEEQLIGVWRSDEKGEPFLEFKDDGTFSGSDGCNGIGGEYTVEDETVRIDRGGSTFMACPGVDDWLRKVASVTFEGATMTVFDKNDEQIGQLHRGASAE